MKFTLAGKFPGVIRLKIKRWKGAEILELRSLFPALNLHKAHNVRPSPHPGAAVARTSVPDDVVASVVSSK
jgi:hypothetical protein